MKDGNRTREVDLLRTQLHRLVEDVEPRPDALPRLLANARQRRSPWRPLLAVAGAAAVAAAAFVVAMPRLPGQQAPEPVSVRPDSYLAAPEPGVITSFDVLSGRQNQAVARVNGADTKVLATDGDRVYTLVSTAAGRRVVEVTLGGGQQVLPGNVGDGRLLAAGGGRIAYLDGNDVVVVHAMQQQTPQQRIAIPPELRVNDLALAGDGRLAVLAGRHDSRRSLVLLLAPDANSLAGHVEAVPEASCGPVAIAWSGRDVAALQPVDCGGEQARVATYAADSGRKIGAGVPFRTPPLTAVGTRLSTDSLGRFLVSSDGRGQWLVDGSAIRPIPPACTTGGVCTPGPSTFWS
ncbi:hypothetical protein [Saccharopolyspora phatthalungensis]|uniref:FbpC C-terminal regulatory nucleotide binding domain-containing protein n=1 Tax=Saccharopolyspora phatthalungensis TaxID=664693 RepID=A0A840Q2B5_9PSEU|nr:hypothetical protein [Saccharopolyspora phatthalungensis]MBB5152908.1 hypothetical protein [Saccharopolyspora phatthalungensis]